MVLAYLHTVVERLRWSDAARRQLRHVRLLFMPLVNPGGMLLGSRANPRGIDLMRNAPIDAMSAVPWLLGGHRLGPWLPWYRGRRGAPMAPEAEALCQVVRQRMQGSPLSIAMDCHSGFGTRDRLWFPYARTHRLFAHLADAWALRQLFNRTYPNHRFYVMEPQSHSYTTHGDLWDYLYDEPAPGCGGTFLPFTLEMGSWLWVKKNPRQLLRFPGMFNPVLPHRLERVLRRHLHLFDFLPDVAANPRNWRPHGVLRERCQREALAFWYPETP